MTLPRPLQICLNSLLGLLVLGLVFAYAFAPLTDSQDEWWHLKTGKWIWEHGLRPPRNDIFAYTSSDLLWANPKPYRWDNHEWFAEVAMYGAYTLGERAGFGPMRALIAAKTAVWLAAFALVFFFAWWRSRSLEVALLFVAVAAAASAPRWTCQPRPPVLTYFLLAFFQVALGAYRRGRIRAPHLLALPVLMAGWANLHGGFILGGMLIAAFFFGEMMEWLWLRRRTDDASARAAVQSFRRARALFGIGVLSGLASLCTPFGWRLYLLTYRVMSDKYLTSLIAELQPPPFSGLWAYDALAILTVLGMLLFWRRVFIGEALWILFLLHQSASHLRHMPLFAIAAAPLAAEIISAAIERTCPAPRSRAFARAGITALAAGLCLWWFCARNHPPYDGPRSCIERTIDLIQGKAYSINSYPVRLCDFIEDAQFHGRMFNDSRYAGYLIWRFSPEKFQVFTDMRYDIFGGAFLYEDLVGRAGGVIQQVDDAGNVVFETDWKSIYDKWDVNFTIIDMLTAQESRTRPLLPEISASKDWNLVYRDPGNRGLWIFLRNTPTNEELLKRCRQLAPDGLYERPGREPWGR